MKKWADIEKEYVDDPKSKFSDYFIKNKDKSNQINPLNTKYTKWPNTLKQFVGKLPTSCFLSVFGHFVGLALKGLNQNWPKVFETKSILLVIIIRIT